MRAANTYRAVKRNELRATGEMPAWRAIQLIARLVRRMTPFQQMRQAQGKYFKRGWA
jgi:hypothetical protein